MFFYYHSGYRTQQLLALVWHLYFVFISFGASNYSLIIYVNNKLINPKSLYRPKLYRLYNFPSLIKNRRKLTKKPK